MKHFAIIVLCVWTSLAGALTAHAQSITTIHSFYSFDSLHSVIVLNPQTTLTLGPDGNFYGTTDEGGNTNLNAGNGVGTVFKMTTNGVLTMLASFNGTNGASPEAALAVGPDGNFYGTTYGGGSGGGDGTVFQATTNGTLTTLASFNGTNGAGPSGLTLGPDGHFYGTTYSGGSSNVGTVFQVTTNGALTTLASFNGTNGASPRGGLLTLGPDGNFYGTTANGGSSGDGTVFKVTTNGTLTTLINFNSINGANPWCGVTLGPDGNFYGITSAGGLSGYGTVFKVTTNGTLTTLVRFNGSNGGSITAALTLGPDGNFYVASWHGGSDLEGAVLKVTTNGVLTRLASFNNDNGLEPYASLTLGADGNFYGTTISGGLYSSGTIFQLELPPDFIMAPSNQNAVIGGSAMFSCQPFGTAPFAYQWLSNGVPIAEATNASLRINPVLMGAAGNYQVVVSNTYGSITSKIASLTVTLQPNIYAITNNGTNVSLYLGSQPNSTNRLWATTNLALNQWQVIATNITDSNGLSQFVDTNTASVPQKFYRLSYP